MGSPVPNDWTIRLTDAVVDSLRLFSREVEPLAAVDLGCFPWHGRIELSALTVREAAADPGLFDPRESAGWQHYNFAEQLPTGRALVSLGQEMRAAYDAAGDAGRGSVATAFMRACARAVGTERVGTTLPRSPRVRFTVCHPDTGDVFWPPAGG